MARTPMQKMHTVLTIMVMDTITVYMPRMSSARWEALNGGVPSIYDEEAHARFTQDVKLEPFQRAIPLAATPPAVVKVPPA